ncbi:beta-N-acetylhexosaminidase [Paenibacillus sp. DCT19]|uniref:beta-N-acetylhexosaminidase n=1 Tax=Paenibacillus sp. DCT19 TaxID=2211212 RepID=UPI000FE1A0F5|nr:beta-N-acetylhexosaminidase [Paenibacillus sp. DCT19]
MSEQGERYQSILQSMSLREKVGQMLLIGFHGTEAAGDIETFIQQYPVGGVIYFARNAESPEQVEKLSQGLQSIASASDHIPLWISIDQEGGMVSRITEGIALMPGQMAIAAAGSQDDAYQAAYISGIELRSMGINMNFAPVLDVNNNAANPVIGVRSFGEKADAVAEYGVRAVMGYQDAGVVATAKHFPGHGDTDTDSHLDLPVIHHDRERMNQVELVPFRAAIAAGVGAVMSAHIYFPALESERLPVTLSRSVLHGLLREEFGYEGMIVTDCMEMDAIAVHYGTVEAAVMAVEAGADLVLISHTPRLQIEAYEALIAAVQQERISEERIDESVIRLLRYKSKHGLLDNGMNEDNRSEGANRSLAQPDMPALDTGTERNSPLYQAVAQRISERSITLVRDQIGMLPLKMQRTLVITVASSVTSAVDEQLSETSTLGAVLSRYGLEVIDLYVNVENVSTSSASMLQAARAQEVEQIIVGTYNASSASGESQCRLIEALQQIGKPLAVVALRSPYDLLALPIVKVYVAAYESRPLAMNSVAQALLGQIPFQGKSPVSIE